jgi:SAM-dependent methyltransferase
MDFADFKNIYENSEEYKEIRDKHSFAYKHYFDVVINWKVKYLNRVIPGGTVINSILEVGCATGDLLASFPSGSDSTHRTGLDISENNIAEAKKRYPDILFLATPFEEFVQQEPGVFDVIILSDILEHVPDDVGMLRLAGENARYVLLNLPLEKCYEFRDREYGPNDFRGHLRAYNVEDARKLVANANLEEEKGILRHYVTQSAFRRFLWNKLVVHQKGLKRWLGSFRYGFEILEILLRKKRYKQNYFAFLKSNANNGNSVP